MLIPLCRRPRPSAAGPSPDRSAGRPGLPSRLPLTAGAVVLALVLAITAAGPLPAASEVQEYEARTRRYMDAYQAYLKAKMDGDPATAERLKEFNAAYQEFISSLNKGQGSPRPAPAAIPAAPPAPSVATPPAPAAVTPAPP
ncbi:MAG: hypothetical protein GX442_00205, partial [Candidatus Riflebacteria bacterium]|nr:hypothetical protein [Candidatus Riflebacteria bacterium]